MGEANILAKKTGTLLNAIAKTAFGIVTFFALLASLILLFAGGHPPGIALIPIIFWGWSVIIGIALTVYVSLLLIKKRLPQQPHNTGHTFSIFLACVYFVYLILSYGYLIFPYSPYYYEHVSPTTAFIFIVAAYLLLAGTVMRQRWAYYLTLAFMSLHFLSMLRILYLVDFNVYRFGMALPRVSLTSLLYLWTISMYLTDSRIKRYFGLHSPAV